jgi:TonB family protein
MHRQPRQGSGRSAALALSAAVHCAVLVLLIWSTGSGSMIAPLPPRAVTLIDLEGLAQTPATPAAAAPAKARPRFARKNAGTPRLPPPTQATLVSGPWAPPPPADSPPALAVAPAPPAAAAPVPGPNSAPAAASVEQAEPLPLLYLAEVSRMIRSHLALSGRQDHAHGTVVVHIVLARDGTVLGAAVIQGAGFAALDEAAREVVLRIRKFPELPVEFARGQQQFAIDQPIGFNG